MTVVYQDTREVPIGDLTRYPGNPRKGNVAAIRESVRHLNQYRSIVVRDTGTALVILAGNHTADAIEAEGIGAARCDIITCTDDDARRIVAADNRTSDLGTYDDQLLADLLTQIAGDNAGYGYEGTGWSDDDVSGLLGQFDNPLPDEDGLDDEDDDDTEGSEDQITRGDLLALAGVTVGEPRHQVTRGQLWRLGNHWLVVGDLFTDWPLWAPLLTGEAVFLPYPTPLAPHAPYTKPLVMVQPEPFLAGHLLDKWQDITGEKPQDTTAPEAA